jgi:DNA-binding MarR family transcriptional regulator
LSKKGKTPQWQKEENRKKIFLALMKEPLAFSGLLEELHMSRGALAGHLRELQEKKIIERTRRNRKRVYQVAFDNEEKIIDELKAIHFDMLFTLFSEIVDSTFAEVWKSYIETMAKVIIHFRKRELMEAPRLSAKELMLTPYKIIQKSSSPKVRQLTHADEIVKELEEMPESSFKELEDLRRSMDRGLKERRKNEGKD